VPPRRALTARVRAAALGRGRPLPLAGHRRRRLRRRVGDLELRAGDLFRQHVEQLAAQPVVLGVGVVAAIGVGVREVGGDHVVPGALTQPGIAAHLHLEQTLHRQQQQSAQRGVEGRLVGALLEPSQDDVADHTPSLGPGRGQRAPDDPALARLCELHRPENVDPRGPGTLSGRQS
jgi:hypothetical protein